MIPSIKPMPVKRYLLIDRCSEGLGYVCPEDGEVFIGQPYGYLEDFSPPFIEVQKNGRTIRTVNCADVAEIEFLESEPART